MEISIDRIIKRYRNNNPNKEINVKKSCLPPGFNKCFIGSSYKDELIKVCIYMCDDHSKNIEEVRDSVEVCYLGREYETEALGGNGK